MTAKKPPPSPPPGHSRLKEFLEKIVKVPKSEIDEKEAEYQQKREYLRKKAQ